MEDVQQLRDALSTIPTPEMRKEFPQEALARAVQHHEEGQPRLRKGLGMALAASLVFVAMTGIYFTKPVPDSDPTAIVLSLNQTKNIKLLFDSKDDLDDVKISIELSGNLELEGFGNKQQVSWNSQLQKGRNVLSLPIIATDFGEGTVIAKLRHSGKDKTFMIHINAQQGDSTHNYINHTIMSQNV
jgi:hypothetical protein